MAEGLPENQITHFTVQGHSHDGINSTKVDFTGYDIFDFITEGDLRRLVLGVVNENTLEPKGGIIINPGPGGTGEGVFIGPDVPAPATGLASTCSINEDGATVRTVTWNKIDNATSYIIELYRSIDSGSNYLKIQEIETPYLTHSFEAAPMANVTLTRYKLIVRGKSSAGISGVNQTITGIQPCVDNIPPAGPKFEDAASPAPPNFFVSFRGFLARLKEQTEADTKWGIGQFEYSVSAPVGFTEGQWIAGQAATGRQTGRVLSVTGLETGSPYYLRVRAYDNSNNYSPWTYWNGVGDDGDATMANADSFTPTVITGTEIGVNTIKTGNIFANTIVAGDIAAHTITAGQIEARTITADEIETNFALINHTIESQSYDPGEEGWMIQWDGTSEFNGAMTVRNLEIISDTGALDPTFESSFTVKDGEDLLFSISGSGDVFMHADLTVGDWTSSSGKGMNWDSDAGELSIRGVIGIVGGWTIDANAMYVGTKTTSGFSPDGVTFYSGGSFHSKNFYIAADGSATFSTAGGSSGAKLEISPSLGGPAGSGGVLHSWLKGFTGHSSESYPGLLIFTEDGSNDGAVYLAAPRFTTSLHFAGFKAVHDSNGFGFVTMGVVDKTDTFITTVASATSVTNVLGYGGLTLAQDQTSGGYMPSATNTLYRKGTELWWNGSEIGGGGEVDSIVAGSNITLSPSGGTGDVTVTATDTTYTVVSPISIFGTIIGFNEAAIGAGHNHNGQTIRAAYGSQAAPGFAWNSDTHTGIYGADGVVSIGVNNSARLTVNTTGVHVGAYPLLCASGNSGAPSHSFTGATNTGMYYTSSNSGLAFSTGGSHRMQIDGSGHVGINKSATTYNLHVGGTTYVDGYTYCYGGSYHSVCLPWSSNLSDLGGSNFYWDDLWHSGSTFTSDISLKENIEDATYGLDFINTLRPITYTKKTGGTGRNGPRTHHGFIAQEVETLLGDDADHIALWADGYYPAVSEEDAPTGVAMEEGYLQGLRYTEFIPILAKGIQELSTKLEAAEARIAVLEG